MQPSDNDAFPGAILPPGETDAALEAWEPEDFDHFTDFGLVRVVHGH